MTTGIFQYSSSAQLRIPEFPNPPHLGKKLKLDNYAGAAVQIFVILYAESSGDRPDLFVILFLLSKTRSTS